MERRLPSIGQQLDLVIHQANHLLVFIAMRFGVKITEPVDQRFELFLQSAHGVGR